MSAWSSESVMKVRELARQGLTAKAIAEQMGRTNTAITAMCRRRKIQLTSRNKPTMNRVSKKAPVVNQREKRPENKNVIHFSFATLESKIRSNAFKNASSPDITKGRTFPNKVAYLKAGATHCHFPIWKDDTPIEKRYFCGAPVEQGGRYCHACKSTMFIKIPQKRGDKHAAS